MKLKRKGHRIQDKIALWILCGAALAAPLAATSASAQLTITNGLTLWLKADAITGLTNGQAVSAWSDSSTNGYNATQSDAAKQPKYMTGVQNGKPVVRFTGDHFSAANSDNLVTPSIGALASMSVFLVAKPFDGLTDYALTFGSNSRGLILGFSPDPSSWEWFDGSVTVLTPLDFTKFQIVSHTAGSTVAGNWYVGSDTASTAPFSGDIAEILVFNRSLSTTERQDVTEYLVAKWAIPEPATASLIGLSAAVLFFRWSWLSR